MSQKVITYEVMHGETSVCEISTQGSCKIYKEDFLPYQLYLEEDNTIDGRVNNITNFYYWCATRVLTLDRQYAKQILSSIGAGQAATDRDRAAIALSYHCLSLTDIYWVRRKEETITFAEFNLYENHLQNAFVDISLRGKQVTVQNAHLIADNASAQGVFPKAWLREQDGFWLLKDGGEQAVWNEILASRICQCFDCHQVVYEPYVWENTFVSRSRIITNKDYSLASREAFEIYAQNHEIDVMNYILQADAYSYYMMNLLDYLVGNTDRHWGNWGFLIDNKNNQPIRLYDLMDFNQSFLAYDTMEGAGCQTMPANRRISQQEAAAEAVQKVGWNQKAPIQEEWFEGRRQDYEMLQKRIQYLKNLTLTR